MLSYRKITILILVVTFDFVKLEGQSEESDCGHGTWREDVCECNYYYTGRFCNISCYFASDLSCAITNCSLLPNNTVKCNCAGDEDAVCLFDECTVNDNQWCSGNGNCYSRKTSTNDIEKCLCKTDYTGINCKTHITSSTITSSPETTITESITQITSTESRTYGPPAVEIQIPTYPPYGPHAGGTKVVIKGTRLNVIEYVFLQEAVMILNRSDTDLEIITPAYINASEYMIERLPFRYNVKGQTDEHMSNLDFEYRPNPTVSGINPKKAIISGGTSVTVTGTFFDSVASPKFKVYVRKRINNDNSTLILKKTCEHKNGDNKQLLCRFPNVTSLLGKRLKRFVGKANNLPLRKIREASTIDQLQFTLGLEFDGADRYEDLADSNPRLGFIDVHPDPTFQSDQEILFDPAAAKVIGIKGEDIDLGTVVEDYKVYIGDAMCTDIGLTFDKLYCSPPENIEDIKDRGSERKPNEANVTVHIGINLRHYVGFITYNTEDPTVPLYTLFIPVVAAIGGVLLILFIILIVCACRKSGVKDEPLTAPSVTDIDNMAPTGNDNYYTGQTAPKDQYYMVVNKDDKRKGSLPPPDKNAVDGRI